MPSRGDNMNAHAHRGGSGRGAAAAAFDVGDAFLRPSCDALLARFAGALVSPPSTSRRKENNCTAQYRSHLATTPPFEVDHVMWWRTRVPCADRQTDSFDWDTNPHTPRLYCKPAPPLLLPRHNDLLGLHRLITGMEKVLRLTR